MGTRWNGSVARCLLGVAAAGSLALAAGVLNGCASETTDENGYSKSTTKRTVDTPTERRTTTETHEKTTKTYPPPQ